MRTVAIIAAKGGVGKTTLAVHLAVAAARAGLKTAIVDLDPQGSAALWGDAREAETPEVVAGQAARLPALLASARAHKADLVLIDTAPNSDAAALAAARGADCVLIPCRPGAFDLRAVGMTLELAKLAGRPSWAILNAVPSRSGVGAEAAEALKGQGASVAPCRFGQRAAFAHGVIDGRTAIEFDPAGKAAAEAEALFAWVCGQLNMTARRKAA